MFTQLYNVLIDRICTDIVAKQKVTVCREDCLPYLVIEQDVMVMIQFCHTLVYSFFFESITWDEGEVGFEKVPGGEQYNNRSVLAWHFYIPPLVRYMLYMYGPM